MIRHWLQERHIPMSETFTLLALGGDGIGPEVTACGLRLVEAAAAQEGLTIELQEDLLHGAAWEVHGTFCRDETVAAARAADAVLVGAVGGPEWDGITVPGGPEMQDGLMRLRLELGTYAGLRPAKALACLEALTPFRPGLTAGADVMVLREMCGGAFFSLPRGLERPAGGGARGFDTTSYTSEEIARFAHAGFQLAGRRRDKLASVDKANVMVSGALWREVVDEVAGDYPDVALTHLYADNAAYQLVRDPLAFDVILADNLFGDILSDQAGAIAGSLGMLPSACLPGLPEPGGRIPGIYEPVHGSAPDIAGKGIANPLGMLLSVAMMFDYSFGRPEIARRIEAAVTAALDAGHRTPDIGGTATTDGVTDAVIAELRR
jgi:3-isopropylmalate dehydrogenase